MSRPLLLRCAASDLLYSVRDPWPWGQPHEAAGLHHSTLRRDSRVASCGEGAAGRSRAADRCADVDGRRRPGSAAACRRVRKRTAGAGVAGWTRPADRVSLGGERRRSLAPQVVRRDNAVGCQSTFSREEAVGINRGEPMASSQVHNHTPMYQRVGTRQNDHAAVGLASEHFDSTLEFCCIASANNCERHREGWHNGLDGTQHSHLGRGSEITHPIEDVELQPERECRLACISRQGVGIRVVRIHQHGPDRHFGD